MTTKFNCKLVRMSSNCGANVFFSGSRVLRIDKLPTFVRPVLAYPAQILLLLIF